MIRKGRLIKNTAIALAIVSVFGNSLSSVSAAQLNKSSISISQYIDGEYNLNVTLRHENKDEDSMANGYLKDTKLVVSNNKLYIKMIFNNGGMIKEVNPTVNGQTKEVENTLNSDGTRTVKFEINSQDDTIKLGVVINPFGDFKVNADCLVRVNEKVTIPTTEDKDDAVTSPTPSLPDNEGSTDKEENNKEQSLETILKHESKDQNSSANKYLKSSKLVEENNKKYMVMVFDNSQGLLVELIGKVNGNEVKTSNVFDDNAKTLTIKFEINSLEDDLKLSFTYNNPVLGKHTVLARIQSKIVTSEDSSKPPTTEDNNNGSGSNGENNSGNGSDSSTEDNSGTNNSGSSSYKNGYYQLKNILHLDNPTGYAMVRNLLSETTNMEVKDGKIYMTLKMSSYSLMSNINIKINEKSANFTKTSVGNDMVEFRVEVPSTSAKLNFSMFVSAMGKNVDYSVSFDKSSIKFISSNEEPNIPNTGTTGGSTTNDSTSSDSNTTVENNTIKGKLYTIKNQVISNSETGRQMARKYLNPTTKIEEVNGKMYATLTFTGVDLMSNHKIYVNGSAVNHTVTSKTSSSISIRFEIPNVNANIEVQAYIIPMKSTVKFGVKLLEDTLTFVKDFETEDGTLPQTGALINSEIMMTAGGIVTLVGALLKRKRK